jgi:hypothetical protein
VLREKDAAFLIHFDREVELLQDLTSSRPKLEGASIPCILRLRAMKTMPRTLVEVGLVVADPVAGERVGRTEVERRSMTRFIWRPMN